MVQHTERYYTGVIAQTVVVPQTCVLLQLYAGLQN